MRFTHPAFEKINKPLDGSILVRQFADQARTTRPYWHYHPELELVYVRGGSGKRHIGSHLSYFHDGELVLIGANLPHQGFTERLQGHMCETVVQWPAEFLGNDFFQVEEMLQLQKLLHRAKRGLAFSGETKFAVGARIERLFNMNAFDRIIHLLSILRDLAESNDYQLLNAEGFSMEVNLQDNDRINKVFNHVRENFTDPIRLPEIADLVSMTEPSFCRYFKKVTGKTFTRFVNDYRLVHASKLLSEGQMSITEVCYASGFSNFSHFNKQFKLFAGRSPSDYRSAIKQLVE